MLHSSSWSELHQPSVQELKDFEEIGRFMDGPSAGLIYPGAVERSLAVAASLVHLQPDVPSLRHSSCSDPE